MKYKILVAVVIMALILLVPMGASAVTNSEALALLNETNLATLQAGRDTLAQIGENMKIAGCIMGVSALCP